MTNIKTDVLTEILGAITVAQYISYLFFALVGHTFILLSRKTKEVAATTDSVEWSLKKFLTQSLPTALANFPLAVLTVYLIARFTPDFLGTHMTGIVAFVVGCFTNYFTNLIVKFADNFIQPKQPQP